jgi:succinate dehydrogenase/fumarate reductase-like Fe-S protein
MIHEYDVVVIGGEIAGLYTVLTAAQNVRDQEFIGPAAVLRAQHYLFDSKTTNANERLKVMQKFHAFGLVKATTYARFLSKEH